MRRIQVYLDDDVWNIVHARAKSTGTTISDLVRQAIREQWVRSLEERKRAMLAIVGLRRDRREFEDPEAYIRGLRSGDRLDRLRSLRLSGDSLDKRR